MYYNMTVFCIRDVYQTSFILFIPCCSHNTPRLFVLSVQGSSSPSQTVRTSRISPLTTNVKSGSFFLDGFHADQAFIYCHLAVENRNKRLQSSITAVNLRLKCYKCFQSLLRFLPYARNYLKYTNLFKI